jgi:hypothetical protein
MVRQDGAAFDERLLEGILKQLCFRGPESQNIIVQQHRAWKAGYWCSWNKKSHGLNSAAYSSL